jgi:hypothetical protein
LIYLEPETRQHKVAVENYLFELGAASSLNAIATSALGRSQCESISSQGDSNDRKSHELACSEQA